MDDPDERKRAAARQRQRKSRLNKRIRALEEEWVRAQSVLGVDVEKARLMLQSWRPVFEGKRGGATVNGEEVMRLLHTYHDKLRKLLDDPSLAKGPDVRRRRKTMKRRVSARRQVQQRRASARQRKLKRGEDCGVEEEKTAEETAFEENVSEPEPSLLPLLGEVTMDDPFELKGSASLPNLEADLVMQHLREQEQRNQAVKIAAFFLALRERSLGTNEVEMAPPPWPHRSDPMFSSAFSRGSTLAGEEENLFAFQPTPMDEEANDGLLPDVASAWSDDDLWSHS